VSLIWTLPGDWQTVPAPFPAHDWLGCAGPGAAAAAVGAAMTAIAAAAAPNIVVKVTDSDPHRSAPCSREFLTLQTCSFEGMCRCG
jgi:hypothetical protein